jgi:hypothetical protein
MEKLGKDTPSSLVTTRTMRRANLTQSSKGGPQLKPIQAAFDIGKMAHRMAEGYYIHLAAIQVARDPRAIALSPNAAPGQIVPVGYVFRKDDIPHAFHFTHYLDRTGSDPDMFDDLNRLWLVGALLAVGDALSRHGYFDHAPELELLRHLRNGVAPWKYLSNRSEASC